MLPKKFETTKLTYSALQGLTNRMANVFRELGIGKGERVLLRLPNGVEFPISFVGAIKAGAIPIPTSPLFPWSELKFLLNDSQASVLITTAELLPQALLEERPKTLRHILVLSPSEAALLENTLRWQDEIKKASAQFETQPTHADDPAFWLYTSGTTGHPKAVIHAHRNIRAHDERAKLWQQVRQGDVIFNTSALNWSYALTAGWLDMWRHGLTSVVYEGQPSPENLIQVVHQHGVTIFMSVPGLYRRLARFLSEQSTGFQGVRVCVSASESLRPTTRENFRQGTGLEIKEGLGMTEHSIYLVQFYEKEPINHSKLQSLASSPVTVLKEKDLSPAGPKEVGILASHKSCPGLMLGYWNRPEEEQAVFHQDWFLSGDLVYRDEAGNYCFVERRDDMITAGGYRISPLEVEKVLNQHPAVEESAVVGTTLEGDQTIVQAHVVLQEKATESEILEYVGTHLAPYKIPRRLVFVEKLPKTSNGKIKRKAIQ